MSGFQPDNPILDILFAPEREPNWLIKDFMLQGALTCLAGEPGAGKSYVSYTLGLAIAAGVPALSGVIPKSKPRRVLYFDEENSEGDRSKYLQRSFIGLNTQLGRELDAEHLLDNFWPIHMQLGVDNWEDIAKQWVEYVRPHLIVVDTATTALDIADENDNAEATQAIKALRRVMAAAYNPDPDAWSPTASCLVLKHAKIKSEKGGRRTMRGAKAWHGMADGVMFQVRATGRPRNDGLSLTRLEPDKTRAYGLSQSIYITPRWTDNKRAGLALDGSYTASKDHKAKVRMEDAEDAE